MKLIVGLGNPGEKYAGTRHNAGFMLLDKLLGRQEVASVGGTHNFNKEQKFEAETLVFEIDGEKVLLIKPQTFMNLSGKSVSAAVNYFKLDPKTDLVVVFDDVDLPLGTARIRNDGSSGGHKGLQNIIDALATDRFVRIRIGIKAIGGDQNIISSAEDKFDTVNFVLDKFNKRELPILDEVMGETISYFLPFIGSKTEIPAHTINITMDSN